MVFVLQVLPELDADKSNMTGDLGNSRTRPLEPSVVSQVCPRLCFTSCICCRIRVSGVCEIRNAL